MAFLKVLVGLVLSVLMTIGLITMAVGSPVYAAADSVEVQFSEQLESVSSAKGVSPVVSLYTNEVFKNSTLSVVLRKKFKGVRPRIVSDVTRGDVRKMTVKFLYLGELKRLKIVIKRFIPISQRTH